MNTKKIKWMVSRMKAMSIEELAWRISQKCLTIYEKCYLKNWLITSNKIYQYNLTNKEMNLFVRQQPKLQLQDLIYEKTCNWHQGIDTENDWPMIFSQNIAYKQCDEIGDARKNWELNRHFAFQQVASRYYMTKDEKYYNDLKDLFYDWVNMNPFLIGISWTSVMEVAIRAFSWLITYNLLIISDVDDKNFLKDIKNGIINMMQYVRRHYSRYSSANNHLIIEMAVLGITGVSFGIDKWVELSLRVLDQEMENQNHQDGVNKEQSIHYQAFVMEGISLYIYMMRKHKIEYSSRIDRLLNKMAEFVADLTDVNGNIVEIGDNDEGKLLDISGEKFNYYTYVQQFISLLFDTGYTSFDGVANNLYLLFSRNKIKKQRVHYDHAKTKCYKLGGHTIIKHSYKQIERLMTFDHAELGFGTIAAHGQADALSITLTINGECVIIDPGTYIYHTQIKWRNYFRSTINHNTIQINGKNQSQMKGAFLWEDRANVKLLHFESTDHQDVICAEHEGYKTIFHQRSIRYIKPDDFIIEDVLTPENDEEFTWVSTFMINNIFHVSLESQNVVKVESYTKNTVIYFECDPIYSWMIEDEWISKEYGKRERSKALRLRNKTRGIQRITIVIRYQNDPASVEQIS